MSSPGVSERWDPAAFRPFLLVLARFALSRELAGRLDASDLVQETLVAAHRDRASFEGTNERQFRGWLSAILRNNLLRLARFHSQQRRDYRLEQSLDAQFERTSGCLERLLAGKEESPAQAAQRLEWLVQLSQALADLPANEAEAIRRKHLEEATLAEVAREMSLAEKDVIALLRSGRKRLKSLLPEE